MNIKSNYDLHIALSNKRNSPQLAELFIKQFKKVSGGLHLLHKEGSFLRYASMYMDGIWDYNHDNLQRIIDRDSGMNAEVVGCNITRISELNKEDSSSNGGSIPSL